MKNIDLTRLITAEEKAAQKTERMKAKARKAARRALAETDWYVLRQIETGEAIPADIALARIEARQALKGKSSKKVVAKTAK